MKLYLLKYLSKQWAKYNHVEYIRRVLDNELLICFDKHYHYLIDLSKAKSFVYFIDDISCISKISKYQAPFDNALFSKFNSSNISSIEAFDNDRILKLTLSKKHHYKLIQTSIQLEFTGRNTNAIILNEHNIIIDALRHIDISTTYRAIRPNIELKPLKPYDMQETSVDISDINAFLSQAFIANNKSKMEILKKQAYLAIDKKIAQAKAFLDSLDNEEDIHKAIKLWKQKADLILSNASTIDIYKPSVVLDNIHIDIPSSVLSVYQLSNLCFKKSKKYKSIKQNIHLQTDNIEQKLSFLDRHRLAIDNASNIDDLLFLSTSKKKVSKKSFCEEFIFSGFKIMIGRNSNENAKILRTCKKDDLWLHVKDIPSAHVVIVSKKQQFPLHVIQKAANLCVDMSVSYSGKYIVDYTHRRYVRIQQGSNVLYTNNKSIFVQKEI